MDNFRYFCNRHLTNIGSGGENPIILLAHISITDNLSAIAIALSDNKEFINT